MILNMSNGHCFIDESVFTEVSKYKWYIASHGYVRRSTDKVYLHRFIMNVTDPKIKVDHKDGNPLNNHKSNLRECTQANNNKNRGANKGKKYKGVFKFKESFRSEIGCDGKRYHLGTFVKEEDAAIAYNRKAIELFGEFAYLNPIEDDGRELFSPLSLLKTSVYRGVYKRGDGAKWVSQCNRKYLGSFDTQVEAAERYNKEVIEQNLDYPLNILK